MKKLSLKVKKISEKEYLDKFGEIFSSKMNSLKKVFLQTLEDSGRKSSK